MQRLKTSKGPLARNCPAHRPEPEPCTARARLVIERAPSGQFASGGGLGFS